MATKNENHALLLGAYKDIAKVLTENGITFFGMYGTALGAVRHKGIIPWDDDIDIAVFGKDLDKVNEALTEGLDPERYYYHNPSADSHPHVIIKTPDFEKELEERRLNFIDIFLLVDYPASSVRYALSYPCIGFELLSHKMVEEHDSRIIKGLFYGIQSVARKMGRLFAKENSPMVCIREVKVSKYCWPRRCFDETVEMEFEDTTMPIPAGYDEILTKMYGDYMTPPPEDQRFGAGGYPYSLMNDYLEDQGKGKKHRRMSSSDLP